MSGQPMSPQDLREKKTQSIIHPKMCDAINILLEKFDGHSLRINQNEIIAKFLELEPTSTRDEVFKNEWLDFVGIYRRIGWNVEVDRPGFNESYVTTYTFKQ